MFLAHEAHGERGNGLGVLLTLAIVTLVAAGYLGLAVATERNRVFS